MRVGSSTILALALASGCGESPRMSLDPVTPDDTASEDDRTEPAPTPGGGVDGAALDGSLWVHVVRVAPPLERVAGATILVEFLLRAWIQTSRARARACARSPRASAPD